jgi:D-serine dehydratase
MDLSAIEAIELDGLVKGFPATAGPMRVDAIGSRAWAILKGELETPVALLRESAMVHNQNWMRRFAERVGAELCPHGKTTMSPQLFSRQLDAGAWGITAATAAHIRVCQRFGVRRILHANQLAGEASIRSIMDLLASDPSLEFYTLVDSHDGLDALLRGLSEVAIGRPLNLLLEIGAPGGRTGVRELAPAIDLAQRIDGNGLVRLAGIECFEGIYSGRNECDLERATDFLETMLEIANHLDARRLFGRTRPIVSAGGSAFFDLVAYIANGSLSRDRFQLVLRSGCYLTHDAVHYRHIHDAIRSKLRLVAPEDGWLKPALEVWGTVQSVPEPGLAFVNIGRRDISYDLDLPVAVARARVGDVSPCSIEDHRFKVLALNDQHLFLAIPENGDVRVGDLFGFGVSHPCTTFDKWRLIHVVDDDYRVCSSVVTFF